MWPLPHLPRRSTCFRSGAHSSLRASYCCVSIRRIRKVYNVAFSSRRCSQKQGICLHHGRILAPHVADMLRCSYLLALDQWSFFIGPAASECAEVCMVKIVSCLVHGLGLGIAMSACSTAACLLLCHTARGLHVVLPPGCRLCTNGHSSTVLQMVIVQKYVWPG